MKRNWSRGFRVVFLVGCLAVLWPGAVATFSQDEEKTDQLALAVGDAQKANQKALQKYSWQVSTNLALKGETKATTITEMHFGADGKLVATPEGGESSVKEKRGLRGHREKKKIEDFAQYLEEVLDHSFNYIFMSKGMLVDLFDSAKVTEGTDGTEVDATDLFVKGDSVHMIVDPSSHFVKSLTFKTNYDGDDIEGSVTLAQLAKGPNRPTQFELQIPSHEIKIVSQTSDWAAQQ